MKGDVPPYLECQHLGAQCRQGENGIAFKIQEHQATTDRMLASAGLCTGTSWGSTAFVRRSTPRPRLHLWLRA